MILTFIVALQRVFLNHGNKQARDLVAPKYFT
jgi:hypothetical protein